MSVVHGQDSEYAKEMRKWEANYTEYGPPGRPYTYQSYPTRMYRADRKDGKSQIVDAATAHDELEQRNLESRGFVAGGQQAALDALAATEVEYAKLAAERAYDVQHRLSEHAAAEVARHEAGSAVHLPTIPETPIKRRGRKPKAVAGTQ